MKKIIVVLITLIIGFSSVHAKDKNYLKSCKYIAMSANMVMKSRQKGVPMQKMMEINEKMSKEGPDLEDIIIRAYEKSAYHTQKMQKKIIVEFENNEYMKCIKALKK